MRQAWKWLKKLFEAGEHAEFAFRLPKALAEGLVLVSIITAWIASVWAVIKGWDSLWIAIVSIAACGAMLFVIATILFFLNQLRKWRSTSYSTPEEKPAFILNFDKSILGCFHHNLRPLTNGTAISQQEICIISDCTIREVHNCFGFLEKIFTWENGDWKEAVAGPIPLNWELRGHQGLTIRHSAENPKLHVIHMHEDNVPKISTYTINLVAQSLIMSGRLLRLDVAVRGDNNISGAISLRFKTTNRWNDPDIAKI